MVIMFRFYMIRSLFLLAAAIATIPLPAQTTTDHYIVELTEAPAADHFKNRPHGVRPALAELLQHRESVRQGQGVIRGRVEREGATIHDSVQVVANALIVSVPAGKVDALSKLPGVKRVFKPLHHRFRPADANLGSGGDFQICTPAMKCEPQAATGDFSEQAAAHGVAALTYHIHLNEIDSITLD